MSPSIKTSRISSIDILRGFIMVIMFIDHNRERFYPNILISDPMDIDTLNSSFYFTRLATHLCVPIFIFLTGLAAWLYANPHNKPPRPASSFLFKRGLFLLLLEITFVNFFWFGAYNTLYLQVIWAIGISMISLSLLCKLPRIWIFIIGIIIISRHNLLVPTAFNNSETGFSL